MTSGPTFDAGEPLLAVALSPDGRWLAAGGRGPAVHVWGLATPDAAPLSLPHEAAVRSLTFTPDGGRLASGDEDGVIRLWDLRTQEAITLRAHSPRWASGVAFPGLTASLSCGQAQGTGSVDGSQLFSVGGDGQVRAWPVPTADVLALACRRAGRNLSEAEWRTYLPFLPFTELCQGVTSVPWAVSGQLDPPRPMPSPALPVADDRPTIYYFEAMPGSVVRFGESVALRWDVVGATEVYLEYQGQRYGKTAPREELFSPAEDTTYRLVAVNRAGERSLTLTISVRRE
jgi:hypothetical protein